jgi:RNA polymerase sigma factor (sigma-70 family)
VSTTTAATTNRTTTEIVRAARNGDTRAIEQIIDRYESVVWATVRSFCMSEADTHDAVQNTWLRMIEHLGDVRDPERLPGWLATTARRECLKILRTGQREITGVDPAQYERPDTATSGPERDVIDRTMHGLLWSRVAELPPSGRRMVIALTDTEPQSYRDFARTSGMPIGSVGPRRMRHLRRLRQSLECSGLGPEAWR